MELQQAAWWFAFARSKSHGTANAFRDHVKDLLAQGRKFESAEAMCEFYDLWWND
jgi:hypothetical protein